MTLRGTTKGQNKKTRFVLTPHTEEGEMPPTQDVCKLVGVLCRTQACPVYPAGSVLYEHRLCGVSFLRACGPDLVAHFCVSRHLQ